MTLPRNLSDARVLIVGAGGLGCPAALALAEAGVGALGLADGDAVDVSNLHRQILHRTSAVGVAKTESAAARLRAIRPELRVETYPALGPEEMVTLFGEFDVVIDAVDAPETKYLLNDAAHFTRSPLVHGGAVGLRGQALTILPHRTACLRCVFPSGSEPDAPTCSQDGVLGAVPGVIGAMQAAEALALLRTGTSPLAGALLTFDARRGAMRRAAVSQDPDCPLCGRAPRIERIETRRGAEGAAQAL